MANASPRAMDPKFKDADPVPESDNLTDADKHGTARAEKNDDTPMIVGKDVETGKPVRMPLADYAEWEQDQDAKRAERGI